MTLKRIIFAATAGFALLATAPAFADPQHWAPAHGWRDQHHRPQHTYRAPAYVYYPARPVIVAPPVYYYPPPPTVVVPAPAIYGHIPVSPGVQIGFRVRL